MGKFENVPELRGTENYYDWRHQTEQLLLGEGVYNHISNGTNPFHYIDFASTMPRPFNPSAPTTEERESIQAWLKEDGKAKSIIMRKLSPTVLSLVPDDITLTMRDIWTTLNIHCDRNDISLQFSLKAKIASYQMKGTSDAEKYVIAHIHANDKLARMGARPSENEAIYALLRGLPKSGAWPMIHRMIEAEMERTNSAARDVVHAPFVPSVPAFLPECTGTWQAVSPGTLTPSLMPQSFGSNNPFLLRRPAFNRPSLPFSQQPPPPPFPTLVSLPNRPSYTFHQAAQFILKEATKMMYESGTPGPGSEYVSAAAIGTPGGVGTINPATGLRWTKNNPSRTPCTNRICVEKGSADGHSCHCIELG